MGADRPATPGPRRLREDQGLPGDFLVGFTHRLMDRRQQLLRDGQPPETARERAVAEVVQAFGAAADQRGWTVDERRIASLADDALGLEEEYRQRHGYEPGLARLAAVGEVLEGERARGDPLTVVAGARPAPAARPCPPAAAAGVDTTGRLHGQGLDAGGRP